MSVRSIATVSGLGLALLGLTGCGAAESPAPVPTVTVTATVEASPTKIEPSEQPSQPPETATPTSSARTAPGPGSQSVVEGGGSATFEHFEATVQRVRHGKDVQVLAEVCVLSLPPDPQGDRTRISWDPWSVWTGSKSVDAAPSAVRLKDGFPAESAYRVGECASGWIPFPTNMRPVRINYKNGVGDVAVWDGRRPEADPRSSQRRQDENVYFDDCGEVRAAGKAPIRRGDPGYGPHLDGDDDGIACER